MIRPWALLALVAPLAACTQPVPPGAQVAVVHPSGGTTVGPEAELLVAGQVWGPGFHSEAFGGDVGIDRWSVPMGGLALTVAVDGQPVRRLPRRAALQRVRLAGLAPGPHEITVSGGGLRRRLVLHVADPPPVRFVPARRDAAPPAPPPRVAEALARAVGATRPKLVPCGDGAFLAVRGGPEVEVHRLGPEGHRRWRWTTAAVARQAARLGLEIDPAPGPLGVLCFGEAAAVTGPALRDEGGGRYREGRYAVLLSVREPMRLVLMPPEGGWRVLDMHGRLVRRIAPGTVPGRGRALARLGDGRWWVLLDGALAPLEDGRPAVALPLPPGEAARALGRPLPYAGERIRPGWHLGSGWPPRLEALDPASGSGSSYLALAEPPATLPVRGPEEASHEETRP